MKAFLFAVLLTAPAGAYAAPPGPVGHVFGSPIESIRIDTDGYATVYFEYTIYPDLFEPGACRQDDMDHALTFDAKTEAGKSILAVLLESKASDLNVTAFGTGRCMVINGNTIELLHFARAG